MHSILLAEDDKTIRMTVEFALTKAGYSVTSIDNGAEAVRAALETPFNLILLDVMLPAKDGLQVTRELRAAGLTAPILMLTALDSERNKIDGLDAGADDYLTKPFSTGELLARIRAVLRRSNSQGEAKHQVIQTGPLRIDLDDANVFLNDAPVSLRAKEYLLLTALATHPGKLCTRQWLASEVWGEEFISSSRTMDNHASRPEVAAALQGEEGSAARFSETKQADYLYAAVPTTFNGESAVMRASSPLSHVSAMAQDFRNIGLALLLLTLIISLGISWAASTRASRPIGKLERMRTDFVANASHELKTPVAGIRLLSEGIQMANRCNDKESLELFSHRLDGEALHLQHLVSDLLDLSRLENLEATQSGKGPCNLRETVYASFAEHEALALKKGLRFSLEDDTQNLPGRKNLLMVGLTSVDAALLVDNLIENAIKYTQVGSVTVRLEQKGRRAILSVSDTGMGIDATEGKRVFERFYRCNAARVPEMEGTGLGLSLVRHVVDAGSGQISFQSTLGEGTTFTVKLPLNLR